VDESGTPVAINDRIMVAVDHTAKGKNLIRRGWRTASALKADLLVVHVEPERGPRAARSVEDDRQLRANLQLADELGARVVHLRGDVAAELTAYAQANRVTQLIIGNSTKGRWHELLHGSVTHELLRHLSGIDIHVIGDGGARRRRD
jgi:two-component system sensor histidine kinase KdpD